MTAIETEIDAEILAQVERIIVTGDVVVQLMNVIPGDVALQLVMRDHQLVALVHGVIKIETEVGIEAGIKMNGEKMTDHEGSLIDIHLQKILIDVIVMWIVHVIEIVILTASETARTIGYEIVTLTEEIETLTEEIGMWTGQKTCGNEEAPKIGIWRAHVTDKGRRILMTIALVAIHMIVHQLGMIEIVITEAISQQETGVQMTDHHHHEMIGVAKVMKALTH